MGISPPVRGHTLEIQADFKPYEYLRITSKPGIFPMISIEKVDTDKESIADHYDSGESDEEDVDEGKITFFGREQAKFKVSKNMYTGNKFLKVYRGLSEGQLTSK